MPVFRNGRLKIDLGFVTLGGELDEADRQCAWELCCELISRVGVTGKVDGGLTRRRGRATRGNGPARPPRTEGNKGGG